MPGTSGVGPPQAVCTNVLRRARARSRLGTQPPDRPACLLGGLCFLRALGFWVPLCVFLRVSASPRLAQCCPSLESSPSVTEPPGKERVLLFEPRPRTLAGKRVTPVESEFLLHFQRLIAQTRKTPTFARYNTVVRAGRERRACPFDLCSSLKRHNAGRPTGKNVDLPPELGSFRNFVRSPPSPAPTRNWVRFVKLQFSPQASGEFVSSLHQLLCFQCYSRKPSSFRQVIPKPGVHNQRARLSRRLSSFRQISDPPTPDTTLNVPEFVSSNPPQALTPAVLLIPRPALRPYCGRA
jgi:hypothetical protein